MGIFTRLVKRQRSQVEQQMSQEDWKTLDRILSETSQSKLAQEYALQKLSFRQIKTLAKEFTPVPDDVLTSIQTAQLLDKLENAHVLERSEENKNQRMIALGTAADRYMWSQQQAGGVRI